MTTQTPPQGLVDETPTRRFLHDLFEERVNQRPSAPALISGDVLLSYGQLDARANQLARHLRASGVATGDLVGLCLERSPDSVLAILAILKAGAAYIPLDSSQSLERGRYILDEAGCKTLVTSCDLAAATRLFGRSVIEIDDPQRPWSSHSVERLSRVETSLTPEHLAYVLYTSGSTGRPKGVMAEHRNVVSFVAAFNQVIGLTAEDRVLHGFPLGFDGSVEEMWMAFSNGAALVVPPRGVPRFGNELAHSMTTSEVSVFSTVPTSLAMISVPLPTVRLLIVSGERCPKEAVIRWATPERRMLNVYGPTETTVNATVAECRPDWPVTIGRPLPGYQLHILDQHGRVVAAGEEGELFIAGPGVARGYLGQPELTERHFVTLGARALAPSDGDLDGDGDGDARGGSHDASAFRAYRTGDLVTRGQDGELLFHGRIDHQVKVRGYRIELAEIEAVLSEHDSIRAAVVTVVQQKGDQKGDGEGAGASELAAHVLATDAGRGIDRNAILDLLTARLPLYMRPAFLDVVDTLPMLSSGKVDRKRLPRPCERLVRTGREILAPRTEIETQLLHAVRKVVKIESISLDDNFFLTLGGYSLLAAQLVSNLRRECGFEVSIRDIYNHPTIEVLAAHLTAAQAAKAAAAAPAADDAGTRPALGAAGAPAVSRAMRGCCLALQTVALYVIYGLVALPIVAASLPFLAWRRGAFSLPRFAGAELLLAAATWPALIAISLVAKWLVIGRYRPGAYPLSGWYYLRFWVVRRFEQIAFPGAIAGSPLMSLYYRLMGARVGRGCTIDTPHCAIFDLVSIGDESSIGSETQLLGYRVENGQLLIGSIDIGKRCFVGIHSALALDVKMEDDARLGDLSLLPDRESIPAGESRRGSPAQPGLVRVPHVAGRVLPDRRRRAFYGLLHLIVLYAVGVALFPSGIPSILILWRARESGSALWTALSLPAAGLAALVAFCLWLPVLKRLILLRARPGVYRLDSVLYLRKWAIDLLLQASKTVARPLYTTIYLPAWLRLLGAKIGRRAEISTVSQISPELTVIGEHSFFADGSMIGGRRLHRGLLEMAESRIGRRSFVGNSAVLPVGTGLGDDCLLGCLSAPPEGKALAPNGTEWLGSPSFSLPHRRKNEAFDPSVTHEPTRKLIAQRLLVDGLRIVMPTATAMAQIAALEAIAVFARDRLSLAAWLLAMPAAAVAVVAAGLLSVVITKKILIGTFVPVIKPLWSLFVWVNEAVNGSYESVAAPMLAPLLGTPYCAFWLRLMGCKIGRGVYLETTLFSEFDLVDIGDGAALNAGAVIQNHLFEDRVMKASSLKVGAHCSVGNMAVVLYDTEMQPGSSIGPLSLLMKGETLPPETQWLGIPTAQVPRPAAAPAAPARRGA